MTPPQKYNSCFVKRSLIAELEAAHSRMLELNSKEVDAVLRGDTSADSSIQAELRDVRRRREHAIEAVRNHVADHGC
jgi:hypothetical protein